MTSVKSQGYKMINQYVILREIGVGNQARVVLCKDSTSSNNSKLYAMKIIKNSFNQQD